MTKISSVRDLFNHIPNMRIDQSSIIIMNISDLLSFLCQCHHLPTSHRFNQLLETGNHPVNVNVHLDSIKLSRTLYRHNIFELLESLGFKRIKYRRPRDSEYKHARKYGRGTEKIRVLYGKVETIGQTRYHFSKIKLKNPSPELITLLSDLYSANPLKLSSIEIAFDFYCEDLKFMHLLKAVVESTVYLKNKPKSQNTFYYDSLMKTCESLDESIWDVDYRSYTLYSSDTRKSTKALKVYRKDLQAETFIRLELTLNRYVLKTKKILVLSDLSMVRLLDLSEYFCFKMLDFNKLERCMIEEGLKAAGQQRRKSGTSSFSEYREMHDDFLIFNCRDWLSSMRFRFPSVMKQVDTLKKYDVPIERFLVDL